MNKDQVKGRAEQAVGKVKEVTGKTTGNKTLEEKGRLDEAAGKIRANYGDIKSEVNKDRSEGA
ncbi:MAG TPA: CsbD family protein [Steroidobacteraceae bacterium]|jgi:uncharacterized protein YjbJ (UPF0337 family)